MKLLGYMVIGGIISFLLGLWGLPFFAVWMVIALACDYAAREEEAEQVADRLYQLRNQERHEYLWAKLQKRQEADLWEDLEVTELLFDDAVDITDYKRLE